MFRPAASLVVEELVVADFEVKYIGDESHFEVMIAALHTCYSTAGEYYVAFVAPASAEGY